MTPAVFQRITPGMPRNPASRRSLLFWTLSVFVFFPPATRAQTRELTMQFTPAETSIKFTLGDILHTVHGSFQLKRGEIGYTFADQSVRGALVAAAASGQSGNRSRDRRMHKDILESAKFPEIIFRPDRVEGIVSASGNSTVQVHGIFSIHGAEHELTARLAVDRDVVGISARRIAGDDAPRALEHAVLHDLAHARGGAGLIAADLGLEGRRDTHSDRRRPNIRSRSDGCGTPSPTRANSSAFSGLPDFPATFIRHDLRIGGRAEYVMTAPNGEPMTDGRSNHRDKEDRMMNTGTADGESH